MSSKCATLFSSEKNEVYFLKNNQALVAIKRASPTLLMYFHDEKEVFLFFFFNVGVASSLEVYLGASLFHQGCLVTFFTPDIATPINCFFLNDSGGLDSCLRE